MSNNILPRETIREAVEGYKNEMERRKSERPKTESEKLEKQYRNEVAGVLYTFNQDEQRLNQSIEVAIRDNLHEHEFSSRITKRILGSQNIALWYLLYSGELAKKTKKRISEGDTRQSLDIATDIAFEFLETVQEKK